MVATKILSTKLFVGMYTGIGQSFATKEFKRNYPCRQIIGLTEI